MDKKKDSDQKSTYSKAAYAWLMTVTSYYKRVSDLGINIDELMTLNTVAANWLYKINSSDTKSLEELKGMSSDEIKKYFTLREYPKGSMIILEEEYGDVVFLVKKGTVKITRVNDEGKEVILSLISSKLVESTKVVLIPNLGK